MAGGYVRAMMRKVAAFNKAAKETAEREARGIEPVVTRQQRRHAARRKGKQPLNVTQAQWHRSNGFPRP